MWIDLSFVSLTQDTFHYSCLLSVCDPGELGVTWLAGISPRVIVLFLHSEGGDATDTLRTVQQANDVSL